MKRKSAGNTPTQIANPDYFTGQVLQDPVIGPDNPSDLRALIVTFAPGARTHWHTHPKGQTIYILQGKGLICTRGGTPEVIRPGDTITFEPGEEHWHGASADTMMVHLAMQQVDDAGSAASWLEPVSDADFLINPKE